MSDTQKGIDNIVNVIVETGSSALSDKLKELERRKAELEYALNDTQKQMLKMQVDENKLKSAFKKRKKCSVLVH